MPEPRAALKAFTALDKATAQVFGLEPLAASR